MARRDAPALLDVLAQVRRGHVVRLELTPQQRKALQGQDGEVALDVLRHLLAARASCEQRCGPSAPFPLTEDAFQAVASRIGHRIGDKRCRAARARLVSSGVVSEAGSYRQPYRNRGGSTGYRVPLLRLVVALGDALRAPHNRKRPVGKRPRVKRARWWEHGLFGTPDGRPPPDIGLRRACRMRSLDELELGIASAWT